MAPTGLKAMPMDRAAKHRLAVAVGLQALKVRSIKLRRLEGELAHERAENARLLQALSQAQGTPPTTTTVAPWQLAEALALALEWRSAKERQSDRSRQ